MKTTKTQTAVEWLVDELLSGKLLMPSLIEKAKELEKQQIINSYEASFDNCLRYVEGMDNEIFPEQYYNETYKLCQ